MKALIKENANCFGLSKRNLQEYLIANRGKWVEIATEHLFDNQYNTVDGFRIYDVHIERIEGEVRPMSSDPCFFVKHPNGHDKVIGVNVTNRDHRKEGFYSFTGYPSLGFYRISRLSNIEFVLVDGVPYIQNGIGYYPIDKGSYKLTDNEKKILIKCIKMLSE